MARIGTRAVVIGASLGGLLTARVLADRFDVVTVVDRDDLPDGPDARKGVPQGRHAHGLLAAGERVIRDLLPGLVEELVSQGAQAVTVGQGRWWQYGGYRIDSPGAPDATFFSRPFLEAGIRHRVTALANVTVLHAAARGVAFEGGRVTGLVVEADGVVHTEPADLVVDVSGRGSQAAKWLEGLGFPAPPVAQVMVDMAYATRLYRRAPGPAEWMVTISDPAESKRFGVAFPVEGERRIVTLAGCHGDHAPTDDAGFLAWAETLPAPDIAAVVRNEEPLTPIVTHRLPSSQWRHFEKVRTHPVGFLVLGDAICSFNPIYGQGMSSAAQQAAALAGCLDRHGTGSQLAPRFYKAAAKVIANPWAIAAGGDFAFPETTGPKPPMTDAINRYVKKAVIAAQHDPVVARALWDVTGLLAPPPTLMRHVIRVRRFARRGPTGLPAPAPAAAPHA